MRNVVFDWMDAATEGRAGEGAREVLVHAGALTLVADAVEHQPEVRALQQRVGTRASQVGTGVLVDRDMVHLGQRDAALLEATADRFGGKAGPVLDAPEAFFLGGGDDHPIPQQAGGGVAVESVPVSNPRMRVRTAAYLVATSSQYQVQR